MYKLYSRTDYEFIYDRWYDDFRVFDYVFCYDKWNDDFKVFAISPANSKVFSIPHDQRYIDKVSVYSLKSDCWRTIAYCPFWGGHGGMFAVGAIHWLSYSGIDTLDIKTESYGKVELPDFGEEIWEEDEEWDWKLGTFGESLSLLCDIKHSRHFEFVR